MLYEVITTRLTGDLVDTLLHRLALDHVAVFDLTTNLGNNGNGEGIPVGNDASRVNRASILKAKDRTVGYGETLTIEPLIIQNRDFRIPVHNHLETFAVRNRVQVLIPDLTATLASDLGLLHGTTGGTTDMEGPHGQLGTGLTDGLCRNDANRLP